MTIVVLYCYMVDDWKPRLEKQLQRTRSCSLYDEVDQFHLVVTDTSGNQKNEIENILIGYPKIVLEYHTRNLYEAHALCKVDLLARTFEDSKILYFHTKGVSNKYKNLLTNDIYDLKIESIKCWGEILEYFLIDKWKECVLKLNDYDTVGARNVNNWWWGNFWWSTSQHIKRNVPFESFFGGSRWQCESWLHESNDNISNIKYFECYPFMYDPYYSILPKYFYDGTDLSELLLEIISAEFGYFAEQRDEGMALSHNTDKTIDVTSKVKELVNLQLNKTIDFFPNQCLSDQQLDPAPGIPKCLRIRFKTNFDNKIYTLTSYLCNKIQYGKVLL